MRKMELLPTQDCEAGYGPATMIDDSCALDFVNKDGLVRWRLNE